MSTMVHNMNISAKSSFEILTDRLDSWKQIAVYLLREVRTVQRWEKNEGLPVHRQFHRKGGTVYAFKHEIDIWLKNRRQMPSKTAPKLRNSDQLVDWSSPTLLLATKTGNPSYVWLVVALVSHRISDPGVVTIDKKVRGRKTLTIREISSASLTCDNS